MATGIRGATVVTLALLATGTVAGCLTRLSERSPSQGAPVGTPPEPGPGGVGSTLFSCAQTAEVVCTGKILRVKENDGQVRITEVLKGEPGSDVLDVYPIVGDCFTQNYERELRGQTVALFLSAKGDGRWNVRQKVSLTGPGGKAGREAVERAMDIAAIADGKQRVEAILGEATSANEHLRAEALLYAMEELPHDPDPQRFREQVVALFRSEDEQVWLTGLHALKCVRADEVVPELIKLVGHGEDRVAVAAARALAQYDTPETVAALVGMTTHPSSHRRTYAAEALVGSHREEAVQAVVRLLDDPGRDVREQALRHLGTWFQKGGASQAVPKVIAKLKDPEPFVQRQAASALGHSASEVAVQPLLYLVRSKDGEPTLRGSALGALGDLYPNLGPEGQAAVEADIALIVGILDGGEPDYAPGAVRLLLKMDMPEATAALRRAAESHPQERVRRDAQHALRVKGVE